MRDLPVELLQQIFVLACTDGGYTGCSLSLVSRRFHDVVHTARYHSVALSGIKQIYFFLRCLENARRAASIQVHHLFISTVPDGEEVARIRDGRTLRPDILPCDPILASAQGPPWSLWPILQGAMDRRLLERIPLLLQAVAADLRTLSIVHSWEFGPFQLPQAFPFLHQLTICGPPPVFPTDVNSGMVLPCFPTLRDLHIVCPNVSVTSWVFASPVLQRLHLSDITPSAAQLPCQLRCLLGSSVIPAIRPSLRQVRIQPRGISLKSLAEEISHCLFISKLQKVHTRQDAALEMLQARTYTECYWVRQARKAWLDSMDVNWWSICEDDEEGEGKDGTPSLDAMLLNVGCAGC